MDQDVGKTARGLPGLNSLGDPVVAGALGWAGQWILQIGSLLRGLIAFTLIILGIVFTKWERASAVIHPMIRTEIRRAGVRLVPIIALIAFCLGFVVIGQAVALLSQVGAQEYTGMVMVTVVIRELGPLVTALLVLAWVGTGTVIELGNARTRGEIEALEALGIDPIHYLVVPRVIGQATAIFSLTVYLVLISLFSGYLFAFLQDVPLRPSQYLDQVIIALRWEDFVLLAFKSLCFGAIIAVVTCYEGLARPLRQHEIAEATTRAVVQSLVACVLVDVFLLLYLLV